MKTESLSNLEVWEAFRQGSEEAFETLYRRFHPILLRYGRKLVSNDDFIRDCIQDLFLRLYGYRSTLRSFSATQGEEAVKYYLLSSLRRLLVTNLAQIKRVEQTEETFTLEQESLALSREEALMIREFSSQQLLQLRRAFDQLPDRQREALHLRYYEALPVDQIAALMEMNYQSTCNILHRGIKNLARLIGFSTTLAVFLCGLILPLPNFFLKKLKLRE